MKLIEAGSRWKKPVFSAESISDLVHSQNEVLGLIDPKFRKDYHKLSSLMQGEIKPGELPDYFPSYSQEIQVELTRINHHPKYDVKGLGLRLFDSESIFVSLPSRFDQWVRETTDPDFDYSFWKSNRWVYRKVLLAVSYNHSTGFLSDNDHRTDYELLRVYNFIKGRKVRNLLKVNIPNILTGLAPS